jgi:hypothetical protein
MAHLGGLPHFGIEGSLSYTSGESQRLMSWEDPDRGDGAMGEMLQIRMQFEPSSTGGVLLYAGGPEGSKGAGDGHFLHGGGRPTRRRKNMQNSTR